MELHQSIANEVIKAVAEGLPADLDVMRFQSQTELPSLNPTASRLRGLGRQLSEAEELLERAHRNARQAEDDDAGQLFVADVMRYNADKQRLTIEIEACEKFEVAPELGPTFETNASMVAFAMSALANTEHHGDQQLRQSLRTVISGETMTVQGKTVTWSLNLELPHPNGTILLGPISGTVENRVRKSKPPGDGRLNRRPCSGNQTPSENR